MADKLLDDVKAFLDDIQIDLTNLHVNVAQALNAALAGDPEAFKPLANLPAGLIDRAQALSARLEKCDDDDGADDAKATPKAAKPKATAKR